MESTAARKKPPIQHGDVIFYPVEDIPTEAKPDKRPHLVAEGEVTGHAHVVNPAVGAMVMALTGGDRFLKAPKGTHISHEEHAEYDIPEGCYRIGYVKEFDPVNNIVRNVVD